MYGECENVLTINHERCRNTGTVRGIYLGQIWKFCLSCAADKIDKGLMRRARIVPR